MAPATSLQLLHTAAVLVMVAYISSGPVLAEETFKFDTNFQLFDVLRERQCLPNDFNVSSNATETMDQCTAKVTSGDVPAACADVPVVAQLFNCFANSLGQLVTLDGDTVFDITQLENTMHSTDEAWNSTQTELRLHCQRNTPTSLTALQQAVYNHLCIGSSMVADCDRQQANRGALDQLAMARREHFVNRSVKLILDAYGEAAELRWAECSQNLDTSEDVAKRYASLVDAFACLLSDFVDEDGHLDSGRLFDSAAETFPEEFSAELQESKDRCGPNATGHQNVTADEFIKCWVSEGVIVMAASDSSLVASAMPEACTISV